MSQKNFPKKFRFSSTIISDDLSLVICPGDLFPKNFKNISDDLYTRLPRKYANIFNYLKHYLLSHRGKPPFYRGMLNESKNLPRQSPRLLQWYSYGAARSKIHRRTIQALNQVNMK